MDTPQQPNTPYPTNYRSASNILFSRRCQTVLLHDDLRLRFVQGGVAVYYGPRRIIMFHENERRIWIKAAAAGLPARPVVIEHINRFLPNGVSATLMQGGTMVLQFPSKLVFGNKGVVWLRRGMPSHV